MPQKSTSILHASELDALLTVIQSEDKQLDQIASAFLKAFSKADHFRAGCALCMLLEDNLLTQAQRISAFYLLCDLYRGESHGVNPFLPVFVGSLRGHSPVAEKRFLVHLITSAPSSREAATKTPKQCLAHFAQKADMEVPDLNTLTKMYRERVPMPPALKQAEVRPVVLDPARPAAGVALERESMPTTPLTARAMPAPVASASGSGAGDGSAGAGGAGAGSGGGVEAEGPMALFSLQGFHPEFVRPPPPLLDVDEEELMWLAPMEATPLIWDEGMGDQSIAGSAVRELVEKACNGALQLAQQQQVLSEFRADPKLVYHCGLTAARLPALVEHNPMIAVECLLKLMGTAQFGAYLNALVTMDMSLHSMEVVNRLTMAVDLPTDFIHLYISNCISSCEAIKDKYMQNRLVRLVCVFLQSLIRSKIINVEEKFIEVQAFCIEFSRIREAAGLFKLLKTLEAKKQAGTT